MELLLMIDAAKGASATSITAVMPHYAYARSDKKDASRISLGASCCRPPRHCRSDPGADDGAARSAGARLLLRPGRPSHRDRDPRRPLPLPGPRRLGCRLPDFGNASRPPCWPGCSGSPVAAGNKHRISDEEVTIQIVGDVRGKHAIIIDDEVATGGSIVELLDRLADDGAVSASVSCTHGLFTGPAVGRLRNHPMIREVVTTDTVPPPKDWPELCTLSVSALFAEAISRIHAGKSISKLFAGVDPTMRRRRSRSCPSTTCPTTRARRARSVRQHLRPVRARTAYLLDCAAVTLFAAVGRASHGEENPVFGVLITAWPFLVGLTLGWLVTFRRTHPALLGCVPRSPSGSSHCSAVWRCGR